jgi:hypothetical protein
MNTSLVRGSVYFWSKVFFALLAPLAAVTSSFAADPAPAEVASAVPIISADETVQKELLNLDRLLETNPKLEETLRNNIDHLSDETFRKKNPEVDALIKRHPGVVRALKTEQQFFVLRIVGRLAHGKLLRKDMVDLDKFLVSHLDIRAALMKRPNQIVQSDFLIAHPALAKFMEQHPSLSTVLLQRAEKKEKDKAAKAKTE